MTNDDLNIYLEETPLLNFSNGQIVALIESRKWKSFSEKARILATYNFIRDEIQFGYNTKDNLSASEVLADAYGQCNTKGTLFMALLRAVKIPCRLHGFTVHKELQRGVIGGIWYRIAPDEILHSWVEIYYNNKWLNLEGFILDEEYIKKLQMKFSNCNGSFCGFGVGTNNFKNPNIYWNEDDTYIQNEAIKQDFGVFNDPDSFYESHHQNLGIVKTMIYQVLTRHLMNANVRKIRNSLKI